METRTLRYIWIAAHAYTPGRKYPIRNIVLHSSDGQKAGDIETLTNHDVSSHWYVTRKGEVYHFVADADTAYHAGKVRKVEFFSNGATVGIEQEHIDGKQDWPDEQIDAAARLVAYLLQVHHLKNREDIKTHAQIADPPGRKQDPVGYPFETFYKKVDTYLEYSWNVEDSRVPVPSPVHILPKSRNFAATRSKVSNRGKPPLDFLNELVDWAVEAPDEVFEKNDNYDVYSSVLARLGPYRSLVHRKAVMLEVLRVLGGFESSWDWKEARDTSNPNSNTPCSEEAGIFQVSGDSMGYHVSLKDFAREVVGNTNCDDFRAETKRNHEFAIEYCARLLRFTVNHHGPIKREKIHEWLSVEAVEEFMEMLE